MIDLFNDSNLYTDPYKVYYNLRKNNPIIYNDDKTVTISRYSDIATVLSSPFALKNVEDNTLHPSESLERLKKLKSKTFGLKTFFEIDGQEHTRMRNALISYFSKNAVEKYSSYMETRLNEILSNFSENEEIDIYSQLLHKIPLDIISNIIGIPKEFDLDLAECISNVTRIFEPQMSEDLSQSVGASCLHLAKFLIEVVDYKQKSLSNDMLSDLIRAGYPITDILAMIPPLYVAGHITTSYLLSSSLKNLIENPKQKELYLSNPSNAMYLEEIIRYDSPAHVIQRTVSKDIKLNNNHTINQGTLVHILLASANRDEDIFENPNSLDLNRTNSNKNISFAAGAHFCMGAALARMELTKILPEILNNFKNIKILEYSLKKDIAVKQVEKFVVKL